MSYTVLARRYRSQTFDEVVGQEAAAQTLRNAITSDRVAHAYLFTGTRGVGKTTMARILAKSLNCTAYDKPTMTPCCKCESCVAINEGEDIDVLEIDGASNNGVESVRELRQNSIYRPARARFKIYIIDEVHMLSSGAFNALLKILEEPPGHVKFIMATTEPNKVLATIQSRCQRFDLRNISSSEIAKQLNTILTDEKVQADETLVRRVARLANGSMRDALSLLDQLLSMSEDKLTVELLAELLGTPRSERIVDLAEAIGKGSLPEVLGQVETALTEGLALEPLAEALQEHFRDLMVIRNCGAESELVEVDDIALRQRMVEQARLFDDAILVYNITVMEELRRSFRMGGSGRALLEAALVRLTAVERFSDTKLLLEQLQHWQKSQTDTPGKTGAAQSVNPPKATRSHPPVRNANQQAVSSNQTASRQEQEISDEKPKGALDLPDTLSLSYLQKNWSKIVAELRRRGMKHLEDYVQSAQ
ncbi:MAG: DNA polymerase III subunit gamma/tau, partial [Planctomycetes bacterium]|nr:DNA polymerase III subunit gamma/tau [Planctomycetota bacterium]